jgi:hypothetical protein
MGLTHPARILTLLMSGPRPNRSGYVRRLLSIAHRPDGGTVSGAAEVTPVEPGQAPLHHEAFQVTCASAACPLRLGWK